MNNYYEALIILGTDKWLTFVIVGSQLVETCYKPNCHIRVFLFVCFVDGW